MSFVVDKRVWHGLRSHIIYVINKLYYKFFLTLLTHIIEHWTRDDLKVASLGAKTSSGILKE